MSDHGLQYDVFGRGTRPSHGGPEFDAGFTRDPGGAVVRCVVSGLEEVVPVELFNAYLASGWIEDVARGVRFGISPAGLKRRK